MFDDYDFDIKPRGPSWRPYDGKPTPRMKMWLGALIHRAREMMDPESFDDAWELERLQAVADGLEPFWIGKKNEEPCPGRAFAVGSSHLSLELIKAASLA